MITNSKIAQKLQESVSSKLGRESTIRKVKNREEYFIIDLAFSYFQKANRNRQTGYRSGYLYFKTRSNKNCLFFYVTHTSIMFSFLQNNFSYASFRQIVINTAKYRNEHFLEYKFKGQKESISEQEINTFLKLIDKIEESGFAKSLFSKNNSSVFGLGNIFSFAIADNFKENDIDGIIDLTWELFMWLYPSKPLFKRDASLNRSLKKIEKQCEIIAIKKLPKKILITPCNGQIEGAHIKPHQFGGSDKLENGLWLCNKHHKMTEGKIVGKRSLTKIEVTYKT
ncbi:MAG: HNH endonuclease [Sphingobacteriia bacterium]|nr:HNH endonuclease [Sphingobacteriia bacterium]